MIIQSQPLHTIIGIHTRAYTHLSHTHTSHTHLSHTHTDITHTSPHPHISCSGPLWLIRTQSGLVWPELHIRHTHTHTQTHKHTHTGRTLTKPNRLSHTGRRLSLCYTCTHSHTPSWTECHCG